MLPQTPNSAPTKNPFVTQNRCIHQPNTTQHTPQPGTTITTFDDTATCGYASTRQKQKQWQSHTRRLNHTHPQLWAHKIKLLRKEVIQPHLPVRLPCYDFVPIADPTFDSSHNRPLASGVTNFHDVTGGVYKARERIHRSVADLRLLATPTSWGRVADPNPNYDRLSAISTPSQARKRVVPTIVACVKPWT